MSLLEENPKKGTLAEAQARYAEILRSEPNPPPEEAPPEVEPEETEESPPEAIDESDEEEYVDSEEVDDENTDNDESQEEQLYTVKVDGQEEDVTLAELIKGYSRQSDYSRKTNQLSVERKAFETEQSSVQAERAKYAQLLPTLEQALLDLDKLDAKPNFDELIKRDPQKGLTAEREWNKHNEKRQARLNALKAERQQFYQEQEKREAEEFEKYLKTQQARLPELIPRWADEKVAAAEREKIAKWVVDKGYLSDEEVGTISSAGAVALMQMAYSYDQGQTKAKTSRKKRTTKRSIKPGSANQNPPNRTGRQMREKLKQTGSARDAERIIFDRLMQRK